ncbi:MAG: CRISPR-associated endonuclease Cas2 [Azospirillaceae bacterium]|nr:CRISPR-associated endonuclease Cas2 [Azospirillaceae bacterium]
MAGLYLISYDIADPKRLVRLHRRLKNLATPIQYSVFLGRLTDNQLCHCVTMIEATINPRVDDVRIYPLPETGWSRRLGHPLFPTGIIHTDMPETFDALPELTAGEATAGAETADTPLPALPQPQPCAIPQSRAEANAARTLRRNQRTGVVTGLLLIP